MRAIVDRGKYEAFAAERATLATYSTAAGAERHSSDPIFPHHGRESRRLAQAARYRAQADPFLTNIAKA